MTITIKADIQDDVVLLTVTGVTRTVTDLLQYGEYVDRICAEHARKRVLMDERDLVMDEDTLTAYDFSESDNIVALATSGIRIACLSSVDNLEMNSSYETYMQNRSLNFRVFTDRDEAMEWLRA